MADTEDKDIPMEEGAEVDEDELLGTEGKNGEEEGTEEAAKEGEGTSEGGEKEKTEEDKKKEEEEQYDDGGAASDVEFNAEDDRAPPASEEVWKWHIEMYPLAPEDVALDNFVKMASTAAASHVVFKENEQGEKRGEAHFYTHDVDVARTLMRTICCRKFTFFRPFIYLYHLKDGSVDQYESAILRLDLIESAKMRWDKQKKNKGDATTRVAKVSNVPLDTSKEFLKVLFARAFFVKRQSDQSEEEAQAKEAKAKEAKASKEEQKGESSTEKSEAKDEEEENEEEEDELVGEFNGNVAVDCCSRASLRGFLLGYRKIIIGSSLLVIKPLAEDIDIDALRKEIRKKRCYEAIHGKEWKPVTAADRMPKREDENEDRGRGDRGRGRGGRGGERGRGGGRGGGGSGGYGSGGGAGVMTGRQKMNEKSMKRGWGADGGRGGGGRGGGGRDDRRRGAMGGGGGGGGAFVDDVRYLQSQLAMNTYELQRQIATLRNRDMGFYDMGPMGVGGGYGGGFGRDEWGGGYSGGQGGGGGGRYGGGRGGGGRKQRGGSGGGGGGGGGGWR